MGEKDTIFSNKTKYVGIFNFRDLYAFCYEFLTEETGVAILTESKYEEKIQRMEKYIDIEWNCELKLTDYFKMHIKVEFAIKRLKDIEINQGGKKIKTNEGQVKLKIKGVLERDYDGKFEANAFYKFLRSVYEKWIIPSRIDEYEEKVFEECDKFLSNVKSYLALEGKR